MILRLSRPMWTVAAGLLVATGAVVLPATPAAAASCYASSCHGKSPSTTGCNDDAITPGGGGYDLRTGSGIRVRLRYSPACRAAWARIDSADPGDRVRVERLSPAANFVNTVASGQTATSTLMVNDAGFVSRACVRDVSNNQLTCTSYY